MAENDEAVSRIDVATLTMAQVFGAVTVPTGISAAAAAAIEAQANLAQRLPGAELFIATAGNGPIGQKSLAKREEEEAREALEFLGMIAEEQKREREEWARSSHTFAGVKLTGDQWGELGDELRRDGPLRQWLISRMVRDGKTNEQATAKVDQFADVFTALSKPPSQRTQAESDAIDRAKHDPDFQRYTAPLTEQHFNGAAHSITTTSARTGIDASTKARSDFFAGAPDLSTEYRMAVVAPEPPTSRPAAASERVAIPAANAGLDI